MSMSDLPETALVLEPRNIYDKDIVGYTFDKVVYDMEKVIEQGIKLHGSYESSLEWHEFNTFSAGMGEGTPIFMTELKETER